MKKILFYEPFAGISGDMNMGAMAELGVPSDYIIESLKKLDLDGWDIKFGTEKRKGIKGTRAYVDDHIEKHGHHHEHRGFSDIKKIIQESDLNNNIKSISVKIFSVIAEAEAKVHGTTKEEVHFHEVGAVDSMLDIVAAAISVDYLKPDYIISTPPQLGGGFVKCAHGKMPVPAPATLEILKDTPTLQGKVFYEATTPTGAAILKVLVDEFVTEKQLIIEKTAYGVGTKDEEIPNLLRLSLAREAFVSEKQTYIIECNIDDMIPEFYTHVLDLLFANGAKDAYITNLIMKKGRPGNLLTVIVDEKRKEYLKELIFKETTTAGLREYKVKQTMLDRDFTEKETQYGKIKLKSMYLKGKIIAQKIEYDEAVKIAKSKGVSVKEVYRAAGII